MHEIKKGIFGPIKSNIACVEFQKRGLPHAHLLVILEKTPSITQYNKFVTAQIPPNSCRTTYLYQYIKKHMTHKKCGIHGPGITCLDTDKKCCKFHYPKPYSQETLCAVDGYPLYARPNNGRSYNYD